jgi:hypothetical protein
MSNALRDVMAQTHARSRQKKFFFMVFFLMSVLLDDACRYNIGNDGTEADDAVALIGVDGIDEQYHAGVRNRVNDNACAGEAGVAVSLLGK